MLNVGIEKFSKNNFKIVCLKFVSYLLLKMLFKINTKETRVILLFSVGSGTPGISDYGFMSAYYDRTWR